MMMKKKGQSTLEYITVFAAIVIAVIILAYTTLQPAVNNIITGSAGEMTNAATAFGTLN